MRILITNDDGYQAKGIKVLTELMKQKGNVRVIAPKTHQSGMSMAVSLGLKQIAYKEISNQPGEIWSYLDATPASCVKFGVNMIYQQEKLDVVVSGINHGSNAGINVIYSGTMGACFVGAEHGIPSIGYSIDDHSADADFSHMERYILELTRHLIEQKMPYGVCYNINAPVGALEGVKWTRQCRGYWTKEMIESTDEQGNKCYRLGGEFVNIEPEADDTDHWAMNNHYLSVHPCTIDQTAYEEI